MTLEELKVELEKQGAVVHGPYKKVDCQISCAHDDLVKIFYIGPECSALTDPFRVVSAERCEAKFQRVSASLLKDDRITRIIMDQRLLLEQYINPKATVSFNVCLLDDSDSAWGYAPFLLVKRGEEWKSME